MSAVPKKSDNDGKQDGLGNVASSSGTTASGTPTQGAVKNGTAVGGDLQKTGDAMGVAVAMLAVVSLVAVIVAAILCRRKNDDAQ